MTLRATIEIIPYGEEEYKKVLRVINVSNIGLVRDNGFGHLVCRYMAELLDEDGDIVMERIISEHDRRDGPLELIRKACEVLEE